MPRLLFFPLLFVFAFLDSGPALAARSVGPTPATIVVHDRVMGRSPLFVGANPGLATAPNWEAWLRDSRMNAARE